MFRTLVTLSVTAANGLLLHAHGQQMLAPQASIVEAEACAAYTILVVVNLALLVTLWFGRRVETHDDAIDAA